MACRALGKASTRLKDGEVSDIILVIVSLCFVSVILFLVGYVQGAMQVVVGGVNQLFENCFFLFLLSFFHCRFACAPFVLYICTFSRF